MSNLLILLGFYTVFQTGGPLPSRMPVPQGPGVFSSVPSCTEKLGTWVKYRVTSKRRAVTYTLKMALVGRSADAKSTWIEIEIVHAATVLRVKVLTEGSPRQPGKLKRVILKIGTLAPVSLPPEDQRSVMPLISNRPVRNMRLVAEERVKTPAGTFLTWRYEGMDENGSPVKMWIAKNVKLWSLVKFQSSNLELELMGQGTGAKSTLPDNAPVMRLR